MGKTVFIVSGGTIRDPAFIRDWLATAADFDVICADGAARYMLEIDVVPSVILGDMDSIDVDLLGYFEGQGSEILRFSRHKDETDTELALRHALGLLPERILIFGALGRRIDHTLANISLLVMGAEAGVDTRIIDEHCELFVVKDSDTVIGEAGQTVSLLPLTTKVTGITLRGFEYSLSGGVMEVGKPYGVSNRLVQKRGSIEVQSGCLLVIRNFHSE